MRGAGANEQSPGRVVARGASSRHAKRTGGPQGCGRVRAEVRQTCVVTLEEFDTVIEEPISVRFAPPEAKEGSDHGRREKFLSADEAMDLEADQPDPIVGGHIDLGALAAEFLTLGLDPHPRKPGASFEEPRSPSPRKSPWPPLSSGESTEGLPFGPSQERGFCVRPRQMASDARKGSSARIERRGVRLQRHDERLARRLPVYGPVEPQRCAAEEHGSDNGQGCSDRGRRDGGRHRPLCHAGRRGARSRNSRPGRIYPVWRRGRDRCGARQISRTCGARSRRSGKRVDRHGCEAQRRAPAGTARFLHVDGHRGREEGRGGRRHFRRQHRRVDGHGDDLPKNA